MKAIQASQVESSFFISDRLHPTPGLNTLAYAVRIAGPLSAERLARVMEDVVCRHACLRSHFDMHDGVIARMSHEDGASPHLQVVDAPDGDEVIGGAVDALRQGLFPDSSVWGMSLLRHSATSHTFLFSAHRIAWDETSTRRLGEEISRGYAADGSEEHPVAETGDLSGPSTNGAHYFAATLDGIPRLHGFPLKAPRPRGMVLDAANVDMSLPMAALLEQRAKEWGLDPFLLASAAASYVLAAYCGQTGLAIGLPFDVRSSLGNALGSFTSILPLGVDTAKAGTFQAFALDFAQLREKGKPFANTSFDDMVAACKAGSDPSANSIFQIAFVPDEPLALRLPGCECRPLSPSSPPQQLDLFLQFGPGTLRVSYATAIIAEAMVTSFTRSLGVFLATALSEPMRELSSIPWLSEEDHTARVQVSRGADEPAFPSADPYRLMTRHFGKTPAKIAVVCNGRALSYAELGRLVNAVATRIADEDLAPGSLVGICLPRSVEMLATLLAVLRQGMAYVPLDPAFPKERLHYMVEHSKLGCIVTTATLRGLFAPTGVRFIDVPDVGADTQPEALPVDSDANVPAYVIYTSGSTGRPKGVTVPRGAMANFLHSMLRRPGVMDSDVLCAVTTLSFDIAVLELLAPLCAGATVVIATEEEARDPRLLAAVLKESNATLLQATPVTWHMLLSTGWQGDAKLKALCGGEALSPALAQALVPRVGELWNMYGPTETTVWSTCHRIADASAAISVGRPIHNTPIYIVDDHLRALPNGVEGRLFIAGAGVAMGYLFDGELTVKRFLPDPFVGAGRMYDTGDRARIDPDGLLYILGRSDFQVKLRGFRIELGEIEARLSAFPTIEQVVCVVRKEDPDNPELVAYYVCRAGQAEPSPAALREHCGAALPSHMVPSRWRRMEALPRTPNGKVDRAALPSPLEKRTATASVSTTNAGSDLEHALCGIWGELLSLPHVGVHDNFFELGGTSLAAFQVVQRISTLLGLEISVLKIFEHPTIAALVGFLKRREEDSTLVREAYDHAHARRKRAGSSTAFDVAIVGVAGRFPGAANLDELWCNLRDGRETVTVFKREDLDPLVPSSDRDDPNYIPARGVLDGIDLFDAAFFNITPNEAELMDPQLRVFMEVAWEAFENSGTVGENAKGLVGVWAGMGNNFYYHHNVLTRPDKLAIMGDIAAEIANEKDHIAPRVSHKLNLRGPSLSVHTACSTTLVVIENAYQALVSHQVDMALAGGVDIRTPQRSGQRHEEGGVFSLDGHCRPFDAAATGTMFGEGAGAVVLKRLDDAIADGDTIHAVIKGAAVNHDGGHKVSYLAPSVEGQARVMAMAMGIGGIHPETISFVEAHGTATPIGDPIEVEALTRVHRVFTQRRRYCAIGSIKGNFGHATTAAGIAGTLKSVLSLQHRQLPATLHFHTPNPRIDFANSPFFVNRALMDWEPKGFPRRAGVSSFGFCGTNAHVILEEAPAGAPSSPPTRPAQLFLLSAKSAPALEAGAKRLADALKGADSIALADAAYTTHVGRKRFEHRRCAVIGDGAEAAEVFAQAQGATSVSAKSGADNPPVVFLFPGQGAQYIHMGLHLYRGEPIFKETVDHCATLLKPHLGCDLRDFLFPAPSDEATATQSLNDTFYTQPAIFTISYSLATILKHWGIAPSAFVGHSIGEFVAATLSGVMDLEPALRLVATRGRLMQNLPRGSMLSVRLSQDELRGRLPDGVDVATVNGPKLCVVAGPTPTLAALAEQLAKDGVVSRMLHTSHAFHSSMMDPVVEPFLRTVESVRLSAPSIPFVSTVTGDWITAGEATDPAYWARHLRSTVLYCKAVQVVLAEKTNVLIECGPRRTCQGLALQHRPQDPGRVLATMPDSGDPEQEYTSLLLALGSLWLQGCEVNWTAFHRGETRKRVPLPSYAFQRKRFWIDPGSVSLGSPHHAALACAPMPAAMDMGTEAPAAAGDDLAKAIFTIVEQLLGTQVESHDEDARFISLGLDSLLLTQLARTVRQRLGFEVTFRDLTQKLSNTRLLANAIRATLGAKSETPKPAPAPASAQEAPTRPAPQAPSAQGPTPGARLGRDARGKPAWFIPDLDRPGKYIQVRNHE